MADDNGSESPSKKTKRSPTKKAGAMGPIPATYEEASSEDKMLIRMREVDGKSWPEIRKKLEDITQAKIGASSLQIRYTRMKANFVVFEQDDVCILSFLFLCFLSTQSRWLIWGRFPFFCRRRRTSRKRWRRKNGRESRMLSRRKLETSILLRLFRKSSKRSIRVVMVFLEFLKAYICMIAITICRIISGFLRVFWMMPLLLWSCVSVIMSNSLTLK